jgi:hypothetical protein
MTVKAGKSTITMEYRRPWEKDAKPAQVYSVTIDVKPPKIVEQLKSDLGTFCLGIWNAKRSIKLSVPEPDCGQGVTRISKEEAARIVDRLSELGLLEKREQNAGWTLQVYNSVVQLDTTADKTIERLRPALEGEAAKALDALLK